MKIIAIAAGALFAALATAASAQYYGPRYAPRVDGTQECWNPHAGHFEAVRPGERQDDLDFSRCRTQSQYAYQGNVYAAPAYQPPPVYANPNERGPQFAPGYGWYDNRAQGLSSRDECWNPHAGHYEQVRPGESQDDLDFSRCRPIAYGYRYR